MTDDKLGLVKGAKALADYTGLPIRQIYEPNVQKALGLFHLGKELAGAKATMRENVGKLGEAHAQKIAERRS